MTHSKDQTQPQIKDMPIDDAKAIIDAGWKALPVMASTRALSFLEAAKGIYNGLHQVATHHPALYEAFVEQGLAFIENRPHWARTILFDLHALARREPAVAPAVIDASLKTMADIEGLKGGGLAYEDNQFAWSLSKAMLATAEETGTTDHLIAQGLKILPASVKGTEYVIASTLFTAAKGNDAFTRPIVRGVRDIMPAIMQQSIHTARHTIDLVVQNIAAQPHLLTEILEDAGIALKAVSREHPGEDYAKESIGKMLPLAKDDPALLRKIVRMGQDAVLAGLEKHRYGNERLFNMLYQAGKDDAQLLPGLIETAWQTVMPQYHGGQRSAVIQDMINAGQTSFEARAAHIESARIAVFNIATTKDTWRIGGPLKILRDALDLGNDRRILSDAFAMMKTGRGRNERETWFIPKDGGTLIVQGTKIRNINDVTNEDFANAGQLAQLGRIASAVFYDDITPDQGRRAIRRETGLRFETLR